MVAFERMNKNNLTLYLQKQGRQQGRKGGDKEQEREREREFVGVASKAAAVICGFF